MFNSSRAAQIAAFFAGKQGGIINVMKLVKLMYLADRASMREYGEPLTYDRMVSMNNGPVLSQVLNLINGDLHPAALAKWEEWITDRAHYDVSLKRKFSRDELDQLSDVDLDLLEQVWTQFGSMDQWTLSKYTHEHCAEWKDPDGSMIPIDDDEVLRAVGKSEKDADTLARLISAQRTLDSIFARLSQ
jgi:uncharacterized phage-associated protein